MVVHGPEMLSNTSALSRGAEVVGATRMNLGTLAGQVSNNVLAPAAQPLLASAVGLAGLLTTGAFMWKGIDIMLRGKQAVPKSLQNLV